MKNRITAVILTVSVLLGACGVTAYAGRNVDSRAQQITYTVLGKALNAVVGTVMRLIPGPGYEKVKDYRTKNFFTGSADAPSGDKWLLGYSSASLQTGNELDGNHFVGGSLSVKRKVATEILDDQRVRTIAVSDGSGINIFCVLDAYGFANSDVRVVREYFAAAAQSAGITGIESVNVSTLHQHSCVDTFGLNGYILDAFFNNPLRNLRGVETKNGKNPEYMENLFTKTIDTMLEAVSSMEAGTLYYGSTSLNGLSRDKRDPQVFDTGLHRLRFVPDDEETAETWIMNCALHCVGNGAAGTLVTGDYPYYMEKYINETAGANFIMIQGAELAISSESDSIVPDGELVQRFGGNYAKRIAGLGKELGRLACSITDENAVSPSLNIRFREFILPVENKILMLASKCGLLPHKVLRSGRKHCIVTEIGYMTLGNTIAVAIMPGEAAPEIFYGEATAAEYSHENWTGKAWDYPAINTLVGSRKLLVFGLTNDQIGYILTDNNWHSLFTENEEAVSSSSFAGSLCTEELIKLIERR